MVVCIFVKDVPYSVCSWLGTQHYLYCD